ncbi:MAG: type I-E CRISPR-associated protein Cas6/Cse3/CasE [Gammaproteobacteria bacterium]
MTYLAQITVDFATVARLHIRDAYDWHQRVWQCFPGRDGQQRNFLTRFDHRREGFRLLIVSPVEPVRPDWCPPDSECWKTKSIPGAYFTRCRYAFQLCANPTRKVAVQNPDGSFKNNGRRVPLGTREQLVAWINRKGEQGGFAVDENTLRTFSRGREYFEKNGMRGLHSAVEFQGVLTVTDAQRFHETFTRGVGSAKAFGFGLLVIAPTA